MKIETKFDVGESLFVIKEKDGLYIKDFALCVLPNREWVSSPVIIEQIIIDSETRYCVREKKIFFQAGETMLFRKEKEAQAFCNKLNREENK